MGICDFEASLVSMGSSGYMVRLCLKSNKQNIKIWDLGKSLLLLFFLHTFFNINRYRNKVVSVLDR